jgi:hypothetical protein
MVYGKDLLEHMEKERQRRQEEAFMNAFKTDLSEVVQPTEGRKDDSAKLRWDLLDPDFPEGIVKVLTFGAKKYDDNNWRKLKDNGGTNRCYAALMRHLTEWRKGNKVDPETNLSHLYHAACNLYFLEWFDKESK